MKRLIILLFLAAGAYSQSCAGRCGEKDLSLPCQCNSACETHSDCCSDYFDICYSCQDRCGESYLTTKPCQCNNECGSHGNCCNDYGDLCSAGPTDDEIRELTEVLLSLDVNNVGNQITVDHQGKGSTGDLADGPYFTDVPESALSGPTIAALMALQDNYFPYIQDDEQVDAGEIAEEEAFLDAVMATEVWTMLEAFIVEHDVYAGNLRDKVKEMWFDLYTRGYGALGSSGFEHTFVGEIKNSEVSGFHNWVHFYTEEQTGDVNYEGWTKIVDLGDKGEILEDHFEWLNYPKNIGGMFTGTSPELELAVYTVCFLARPSALCPVQMNGHKFNVQTWEQPYGGKVLVGSAYPKI